MITESSIVHSVCYDSTSSIQQKLELQVWAIFPIFIFEKLLQKVCFISLQKQISERQSTIYIHWKISAGQSEQMYYELLQKKDYLHYAQPQNQKETSAHKIKFQRFYYDKWVYISAAQRLVHDGIILSEVSVSVLTQLIRYIDNCHLPFLNNVILILSVLSPLSSLELRFNSLGQLTLADFGYSVQTAWFSCTHDSAFQSFYLKCT